MNLMSQDDPSLGKGSNAAPLGLADIFGVTAALQMLRRRFWLMLLVGAATGACALTFFMTRTPTYEATALVMINPRQERLPSGEDVLGQLPRDSAALDSEIELLRSSALMGKLVDALAPLQASPRGATAPPLSPSERQALADELAGSVSARRKGLTYVIEITAHATNPQRAQLIANTYADVYVASQVGKNPPPKPSACNRA
jgi:uncharacterized protein involved in exopolysaccharide biosynthesis